MTPIVINIKDDAKAKPILNAVKLINGVTKPIIFLVKLNFGMDCKSASWENPIYL